MEYNTFEEAFVGVNTKVFNDHEFKAQSRTGESREILGLMVKVLNPESGAVFQNKNINRISYDYAEKFWGFLISGGTDAEEVFKDYPQVSNFISKPKSDVLPDNFNTFYGPRIAKQIPVLLEELKKENSRRVVLHILNEEDQKLLNLDEKLEYPCTDSITFNVRNGKLYSHCHMRSQNCAVVMQLDFYLQWKLMEHVANQLGLELGTYTHSIVSAHIFERDIDYISEFIEYSKQ